MPMCVDTAQELAADESAKFTTSSLSWRVVTQCYSTISDQHMKPKRTLRPASLNHWGFFQFLPSCV